MTATCSTFGRTRRRGSASRRSTPPRLSAALPSSFHWIGRETSSSSRLRHPGKPKLSPTALPGRLPARRWARRDLVQLGQIGLARLPLEGGDIGLDLLRPGRAGDHRSDCRLRGEAGDRYVEDADPARPGEGFERLDHVELIVAAGLLSRGEATALGSTLAAAILAAEQTAGEREVRQDRDAKPLAGRRHLRLDLALEQAVFVLQGDEAGEASLARDPLGFFEFLGAEV